MPGEDLYDVLGVPPTASPAEIARTYRRLVRTLHPDARPGDPDAAERFARVTAAYRVLADPRRRADYDRLRAAAGETAGPLLRGQRIPVTIVDGSAAGTLLGASPFGGSFLASPFPGSAASPVGRRAQPTPRRGPDAAGELTVDLPDAIAGHTVSLQPTTSGNAPHQIRVPAGVSDGQRLRLPAAGRPGQDGGPPGDLVLTVRIRPHPRFARRGDDLTITMPITLPEAVSGAQLTVPDLQGRPISVQVPPGTQSGDVVRIPGAGVPAHHGTGDLLVTVTIDVPTALSAAQRAAVDALARVLPDPRRDSKEKS